MLTPASVVSDDDNMAVWLRAHCQAGSVALLPGAGRSPAADQELLQAYRRMQSTLAALAGFWPSGSGGAAGIGDDPAKTEVTDGFAVPGPPFRFGRFHVLSELGRGGEGIVFRAIDPVLERIVALKVPRPERLASSELRERFLREARAVAALSHPHLVQVFEAGAVGPVAYIASAYCPGPTLAVWLKERQSSLSPHAAARLIALLAEAVDYVHAQGILHRDLKPGNVLLEPLPEQAGAAGRGGNRVLGFTPKLTDFGLAKIMAEASDQTQAGAVLGTACYMAPEQAEGRLGDIGPATDVYALGAILYELLAGRQLYRGSSDHETLRLVVAGQAPPPRQVCPNVPRDLDAVCLRCLEAEPARRYPTAGDLAVDLNRFLRGEPVRARRAGPAARLAKACRRKPLVAGLSACLIGSLIVGAAAASWYGYRAEMSGRRAEADFRQAHAAVRDFHAILDDDQFESVIKLSPLREEILRKVLHYYRGFLENHSNEPALQADIAEAHYRIAFAYLESNRDAEAMGHLERSLPLWTALVGEHPDDSDYPYFLAKTHNAVGWLRDRAGCHVEAAGSYRRASGILEPLAARHPTQAKFQNALAENLTLLGRLCRDACRNEEAMDYFHRAFQLLEFSAASDPSCRHQLAEALNHLGETYRKAGSRDKAYELYDQSRQILERLVEQRLRLPWSTSDLGKTYYCLGLVHQRNGNRDEAQEYYARARGVQETLLRDYPRVPAFTGILARTCVAEGTIHRDANRWNEAAQCFRRACELHETYLTDAPDPAKAMVQLAAAYSHLGNAYRRTRQCAGAARVYQREVELRRRLLENQPDDPSKHKAFATAHSCLAACIEPEGGPLRTR